MLLLSLTFLHPRYFCVAYHYFLSRVPTIQLSEFRAICMVAKPEPNMLLTSPIILSRISHNFHPLFLFIPMLLPITYYLYYFSNLIVSLVKLHMAADK